MQKHAETVQCQCVCVCPAMPTIRAIYANGHGQRCGETAPACTNWCPAPSAPAPARTAGPSSIQTLRGNLCGREVALVLCGEAHEDAVDLTRTKSILEPTMGWVDTSDAFLLRKMRHSRSNVTLQVAKKWASHAMTSENDGVLLLFHMVDSVNGVGTAKVFMPQEIEVKPGEQEENTQYFLWKDLDPDARYIHDKKAKGIEVLPEEHDSIIARRKKRLRMEGVELFDDWLIRAGRLPHVEIILEGPVRSTEVELHEDPDTAPAPIADESCQAMELDSGEEFATLLDQDMRSLRFLAEDGTGAFLQYLVRRVRDNLPSERVHFFELRELGNPDDDEVKKEFQCLVPDGQLMDLEEEWLEELQLPAPRVKTGRHGSCGVHVRHVVPSWEAFFGAASELLYFSPHVRADFVPFLACVMKTPEAPTRPKDWVLKFFEHLYCGVIADALAMLRSDPTARAFLRLRSAVHRPPGPRGRGHRSLVRRQDVRHLVPVSVAPVDRYLKAKAPGAPRTWVSALAERVRWKAPELVEKAQQWYLQVTENLLEDARCALCSSYNMLFSD